MAGVNEIVEWRELNFAPDYSVSRNGGLRRGERLIAGSVSKSTGYRRTVLFLHGKRKEVLFHRLVAYAFIGTCPPTYEVNHKDGCKLNNDVSNLEYVTKSDNLRHAWANGLAPIGARHGRYTKPERSARGERVNTAVLTENDVRRIRRMRGDGMTFKQIADAFKISKSQAFNVGSGAQWRHVA